MFENRGQMLKEEVTYYPELTEQLKSEEAMHELEIPKDTEEPGTNQDDCEDSSDVFIGPSTKAYFVKSQRFLSKVCST